MTDALWADAIAAYLIQYLGLGAVFAFGLWVAFRQGDIGLETPRQRKWLAIMVGGYVLFAAVHGFFQFAGPAL